MEQRNQTCVSEFILLGLSEEAELQPLVFCLFLSMYLVIFIENSLIILAITDSHLHIPMYLFLSNLSFSDICFTSTIIPKMLLNIQTQSKVITYEGCITQMYFYMLFGGLDNFLLTEMAYDRFVAICYPLHYMVVMNSKLCGILGCLSNYKKDRTMKVYCCSCQRKAAASWMICFRKKIICHITDCISSVKIYANYSRKRLHVELESTSN